VIERLCALAEDWTHAAVPDDDQTVLVVRREPDPARSPASGFGPAEADACVAHARASGFGLHLRADLNELERLRPWLEAAPRLGVLPPYALAYVESALYEVCANVVEHGYGCDGQGTLELWWVTDPTHDDGPGRGEFVLVEHGLEFDLSTAVPADLSRLESRLKGRGLGIAMIRRMMPLVRYQPASAHGRVTRLVFDIEHALGVLKGVNDAKCA
jgi:anti-sigma regulatory factor (Ser/Thr protein kinase)